MNRNHTFVCHDTKAQTARRYKRSELPGKVDCVDASFNRTVKQLAAVFGMIAAEEKARRAARAAKKKRSR